MRGRNAAKVFLAAGFLSLAGIKWLSLRTGTTSSTTLHATRNWSYKKYEMSASKSGTIVAVDASIPWCRAHKASTDQPSVLIIVLSQPSHRTLREGIRHTWGKPQSLISDKTHLIFFAGSPARREELEILKEEAVVHGDVITDESFADSYQNLTTKTLRGLNLFLEECAGVDYLLKVDDDTAVNTNTLLNLIKETSAAVEKNAIIGSLQENKRPQRSKSSKWIVSQDEYKGSKYPDFVAGCGYLMSRMAVEKLLLEAHKGSGGRLDYIHLEDVFVTGILAERAQIPRQNHNGFHRFPMGNVCDFNDAVLAHYYKAEELKKLWRLHVKRKIICYT